jgi:NAD(P)-dependent dehydrogenase (short-subunit alcohol dehydrogenase family)
MKSQREEYMMGEKSLAGRKALVTGGARGIGAAIAAALTNAGASDPWMGRPNRAASQIADISA